MGKGKSHKVLTFQYTKYNIYLSRTISQTMSNSKRLLVYVVPVTAISFALNIPKFMEVKLTQTNESTINLEASDTRKNPTYIFWYTLSLIWHPTMTTGEVSGIYCNWISNIKFSFHHLIDDFANLCNEKFWFKLCMANWDETEKITKFFH